MNTAPLVSICVITYNSADTIVETLESVRNQTYQNIELVISDDGSKDNTLELCNQWLSENKERFKRVSLQTVDCNTGVSANYNRAIKECKGEWIKNIDGDDLILPECIQDNISFVNNAPEANVVFSDVNLFVDSTRLEGLNSFFSEEQKTFFLQDSSCQYITLLKKNILPSQSAFIRSLVLKAHPYNELYRGLEDYPMWLTLSKNGYKFYFFDKCTALYRIGESATKSQVRFFSPLYFESLMAFAWSEIIPQLKEKGMRNAYIEKRRFLLKFELYDILLNNKVTWFSRILSRLINLYVNHISSFH